MLVYFLFLLVLISVASFLSNAFLFKESLKALSKKAFKKKRFFSFYLLLLIVLALPDMLDNCSTEY